MRDPMHTHTCPTCGLPTSVFLLTTPEIRCPQCRDAWKETIVNGPPVRGGDAGHDRRRDRSIGDLI